MSDDRCPKCGGTFSYPKYRITESGYENLVYTCLCCMYEKSTPTLDNKTKNISIDKLKDLMKGKE